VGNVDPEKLARSIVERAPSFRSDQKTFFIVERDLAIPEERVLDYARQILAADPPDVEDDNPDGLVAAFI